MPVAIWSVSSLIIASVIAYAGILKLARFRTHRKAASRPRLILALVGLAELIAAFLIIAMTPHTSALFTSALFAVYAGAYGILVATTGSCNCFMAHSDENTDGNRSSRPARILKGVLARLMVALGAVLTASQLNRGDSGLPLPIVLAAAIVLSAALVAGLATDFPVRHGEVKAGTTAVTEGPTDGGEAPGMSRRGFIVRLGAVTGAMTAMAVGLVSVQPAYSDANCWDLTQLCVTCCDEVCPHGDCYDGCTTCFYRCQQGWECGHYYGCRFGSV